MHFRVVADIGEEGLEVPLKSLEEVLFLRRAYFIDIEIVCYSIQHMHTSTAPIPPTAEHPMDFLLEIGTSFLYVFVLFRFLHFLRNPNASRFQVKHVWFPRPSLEKSGR